MANHISNSIVYYALLRTKQIEKLASFRHASEMYIGDEGELAWVKGLTLQQAESVTVQSIPGIKIYYADGEKLFPKSSLLPERNTPLCNWTPIASAMPLEFPDLNHNYFGIEQNIDIQLIPSSEEQYPAAMLTQFNTLEMYVKTASDVRFRDMFWLIAGEGALITGVPLLPIPGTVFWRKGIHLIPMGYRFEYPALIPTQTVVLQVNSPDLVVWNTSGNCWVAAYKKFRKLSRDAVQKNKTPVDGRY
jgi:hypothetical protein